MTSHVFKGIGNSGMLRILKIYYTKITQDQLIGVAYKNVFRFNVSVNEAVLMQNDDTLN